MGKARIKIGSPGNDEPGRIRFGNAGVAQEIVAQHIFHKKIWSGEPYSIDWRRIKVLWINPSRGMYDWEALVVSEEKPDKVYKVTYTRATDEMKVDTFTRRHVPRFY